MVDVKCLSDWELQHQLMKLGFSPGPILPSTRGVYEKKLVQLLVTPSCAPPAMNGPRKLDGPQDSDDSEELNVTLKGNTILSTEKSKESKKLSPDLAHDRSSKLTSLNLPKSSSDKQKPVFEIQDQQENTVKPNCDYNNFKMLIKRPKTSATKRRAADICCLRPKPSKGIRCAARARNTRSKHGIFTKERCYCATNQSVDSVFPVGMRLAILGILIIVLFVYVTMEKKPLFG